MNAWTVLLHYGFQPKLVNLMQNLYNNTKSAVTVGRSNTDWFKQTNGIRQECVQSPALFNIYLEHVMQEALEGMEFVGASINGNIVNNLCFADDIDMIARQLGDLQQLLNKVEEVSTCTVLKLMKKKQNGYSWDARIQ